MSPSKKPSNDDIRRMHEQRSASWQHLSFVLAMALAIGALLFSMLRHCDLPEGALAQSSTPSEDAQLITIGAQVDTPAPTM